MWRLCVPQWNLGYFFNRVAGEPFGSGTSLCRHSRGNHNDVWNACRRHKSAHRCCSDAWSGSVASLFSNIYKIYYIYNYLIYTSIHILIICIYIKKLDEDWEVSWLLKNDQISCGWDTSGCILTKISYCKVYLTFWFIKFIFQPSIQLGGVGPPTHRHCAYDQCRSSLPKF